MTRIALIEVTFSELGADYTVHAQLVHEASRTRDLAVLSVSNPALRDVDTPGIERRFVTLASPGSSRVTRQIKLARDLPMAMSSAVRLVRDFKPDVIYSSQQRRDVLLAGLVSRLTKIPLIVHLHYPYGPWLGRRAAAAIKRADHVIAVSEFVRETALLRGLKDDRVSTIHNITSPVVGELVSRAAMREQLGIAPDAPMVVVVGRLDPNKHISSLLAVLPGIVRDIPDVRVVICGRSVHVPGHDDELRQLASSSGLDEHVRFLGHCSDVPSVLAAADVFCLPTEMEAFGLVFIEAMRASLPVVAVRSGGVPETVADGVTGLLSYPGDLSGLEANLRRVLVDRAEARAMGIAGRERLDQVFDGPRIAERWITVVESVVRESRGG